MAFEWDIFHPSKHVPLLYDFVALAEDLSAAAFVFSVAANQGGSALTGFPISTAGAGSQGVSASYDSSYEHPSTGAVVGATTITVQVNEATLEALTFPTAPGDLVGAYDLLITPSGGVQRVHAYGAFTVQPGVGD